MPDSEREHTEKAWYKLDNVAKIFPPNSHKSDTKVFRISCELTENADKDLLQAALERALDDFPNFRYILKRGMFWYYLEQSDFVPVVHKEDAPPCSTSYLGRRCLLFEVTYYGRRINFEAHHTLTDGTGAVQFMRILTIHYLKLAHPEAMSAVRTTDLDASHTQKMTDSFDKYYTNSAVRKPQHVKAYQIKGEKEAEWRLSVIEGSVPAGALLAKAREHGATVTAFISAMLICAIRNDMSARDIKRPVVLSIPVNLRNYFDSKSMRNFFGLINIKYDFSKRGGSLDDLIKAAGECLEDGLRKESLQAGLNHYGKFERNAFIRIVPLSLKDAYLHHAGAHWSKEITAQVSNVGKIIMPEEAKPFIKLFDVFMATKRIQLCICSYEDNMNISITAPFVSKDIQCDFFRQLTSMGIGVIISANDLRGK